MVDSGMEDHIADGFLEWIDQIASDDYDFDTHELLTSMTGLKSTTLYHFFREHSDRFTTGEVMKHFSMAG
jgi:hypothetical protein